MLVFVYVSDILIPGVLHIVIEAMKPWRESSAATKYLPATPVSWGLGFGFTIVDNGRGGRH